MVQTSNACWLLLTSLCLTACVQATPETASESRAPRPAVAPAQHAAIAPCPAAQLGDGGATSKVRHIPNEDDPCAQSHGVAPH